MHCLGLETGVNTLDTWVTGYLPDSGWEYNATVCSPVRAGKVLLCALTG
jgi:hypothetical protein